MKKIVKYVIGIGLLLCAFVLGLIVTEKKNETQKTTEIEMEAENLHKEEEPERVSLFSWYFELTNQAMFSQLSEPLKAMEITRIYQLMSAEQISEPETIVMVSELNQIGIETVVLTGSPVWINDGPVECEQIIDSIASYNQSAPSDLKINAMAIDVEVHNLPEWNENPKTVFANYVEFMKHIKKYANAKGIKVIQVIPTFYDDVDKALFDTFLTECCDELSIMNYNRKSAHKDIEYEVKKAGEYGIPVESIFETMPMSEEYAVTSDMTYYYDGIEALTEDAKKLKDTYGENLGIAYHHYTTLYEVYMGEKIGEITLDIASLQEGINPGNLLLRGEDGSVLVATPYWPAGKKEKASLGWLVIGAKEDVSYSVTYYDLYNNQVLGDIKFVPDGKGKIKGE